jgi:conjugative transfer signal peptidase TraF
VRKAAGIFFLASITTAALGYAAGVRVNASPSMPQGLWLETKMTPGKIARGDIVIACLPPDQFQRRYLGAGFCETGLEPVVKPVVAVAGDAVEVTDDGVSVNGYLLPDTAPRSIDGQGRPLLHTTGFTVVSPGFVWLVVQRPDSFDSRYIGPIPIPFIRGAATPIAVWR